MPRKGFSLIEIIVAIGVFALLTVGLYSLLQFVFKSVYQSRLRILETSILNEQIELIRNLTFSDVGILNGSPPGVLTRTITTTRDGIPFIITRTIRNVDDPADGTIGGDPNDTAAADYKFVDVSIICTRCTQNTPLTLSTIVGPRYLEGDPTHGALFIDVFDPLANPIVGADVHVVATSTSPTFDFTETTDNNGRVSLVDLPSGVTAYHITVTKAGHTTDGTVAESALVPNPTKPPATVVAQDLTEISFTIEPIGVVDLSTLSYTCQPIGGVDVDMDGTKLIATNPDILLISTSTVTSAGGLGQFSPLISDAYGFGVSGYDVIGTIPQTPVTILTGTTQPVSLILGANTTHSLLVNVRDGVTRQPLPGATVTVTTSLGYNVSQQTGVGFLRQTDWSDGSGQELFVTGTMYWQDDSNVDAVVDPGNVLLRAVGLGYTGAGTLESSIFDFGSSSNYGNIIWEPVLQLPATGTSSLKFHIATSNSSTPASWNYYGPDGTPSTYYDVSDTVISSLHDGEQFLRYRIYLETASSTVTPVLSDLVFTYTNSCSPPGQAFFSSLSAISHGIQVTRDGYQTQEVSVTPSGDSAVTIDLLAL